MKSRKIKHITFVFALFILGCSGPDSIESVLQPLIDNSNIENGAILLVPNAGCSGCISSTEDFIINNKNHLNNLHIIFTNIQSLKILKARIGESLLFHKNVRLDHENQYYKGEFLSIYPHIIYVKDSDLIEIVEVSPQNTEALSNLQMEIESN